MYEFMCLAECVWLGFGMHVYVCLGMCVYLCACVCVCVCVCEQLGRYVAV